MDESIIVLENITFKYGEKTIIDDVSLNVKRGEHIGIVGESGCGKSTLLRIIAGLRKQTSGRITVAGESEPDRITAGVSMVMQRPMLMPLSVRDNILLGHEIPKEKLDYIVRASCLDSWIETLPDGTDTYLGDNADELSGGQAQRIAIARAMAKDTDIVILDEPTSALDNDTTSEILEALEHITTDKTVIHVTHRVEHLKGYDRIYRMENGKLLSVAPDSIEKR